jgi:hypothetical protein
MLSLPKRDGHFEPVREGDIAGCLKVSVLLPYPSKSCSDPDSSSNPTHVIPLATPAAAIQSILRAAASYPSPSGRMFDTQFLSASVRPTRGA